MLIYTVEKQRNIISARWQILYIKGRALQSLIIYQKHGVLAKTRRDILHGRGNIFVLNRRLIMIKRERAGWREVILGRTLSRQDLLPLLLPHRYARATMRGNILSTQYRVRKINFMKKPFL